MRAQRYLIASLVLLFTLARIAAAETGHDAWLREAPLSRESLAALGNRFSNLAYVARLAASLGAPGRDIPRVRDQNIHFNAGGSYFFSDGGARTIHSVEGDLFFQKGGLRLLGEFLYSVASPSAVPAPAST